MLGRARNRKNIPIPSILLKFFEVLKIRLGAIILEARNEATCIFFNRLLNVKEYNISN